MTNSTPNVQNMKPAASAEDTAKFNAKIKETWGKLSDDDVKLYGGKRDQFFAKLKEKENVSKEDAEKKMQELEKACGTACSTEKTDPAKTKAA